MAQGSESIESKVFREHSSSFIEAITRVTPLANKLHEKSLIDKHTYNEVTERASGMSQLEKATEVVKVLQKTLSVLTTDKKRQEIFEQILSVFREFIPLRYIAEEAREAYEVSMAKANTPQDCLGVLLLGRTGMGKSTTGNKLLKAGGESVLHNYEIKEFDVDVWMSCTCEVHSVFRPGTGKVKAVQVVDTPGFADSDTVNSLGVSQANRAMFHDIITKLINDKLRIHRVLYFLPCRGPLERVDAVLQEEIQVMHHFFGNAIFEHMVLVATLHERYQRYGFDDDDKEETREVFQNALKFASIVGDRPECPPVIYIGLEDPGVDIQRSIESAPVVSNKVLTLDKLVQGTCSKCSAKYLCHENNPSDPKNQIGVLIQVKSEGSKCKKEEVIPYSSSRCHPFIRKRSFWARLTCVNCQQSPGSDGCWKVGKWYKATGETDIIVDHTNQFEDYYSKYLDLS